MVVRPGFSSQEQPALDQALALLAAQLEQIRKRVPAKPLAALLKVTIWVSPPYPSVPARAEYHPGASWLRENGRDPAMAKGVELTNVAIFAQETRRMPLFVLHELAHAYHDQVLTYADPRILDAYDKAKKGGKYEKVLRQDATGRRSLASAYALTNAQEYFAEGTEAYFGANDFYPFNRAELKTHDPILFALLGEIWR